MESLTEWEMKDYIIEQINGVGWPPLKDLLAMANGCFREAVLERLKR